MNSKSRGLLPFEGKKGDRFPMWYGGAPETTQNIMDYLKVNSEEEALYVKLGMDYVTLRPQYRGKEMQAYGDGSVDTIWGIRRKGYHYGQAMNCPLAEVETVQEVENYKWPSLDVWDCKIDEDRLSRHSDKCIIGGTWAPFFHDAVELRGMEQFFVDLYLNPAIAEAITEKCFAFYYELNRRIFQINPNTVDFYFMGNDFGSQRSLLMSPEHWRKLFKPRLRKMVEMAHANGAKAGLHSCGDIHEIIPDLIDIGFDAVNPIQVNAEHMEPEKLKREYGKDIIFFGGIDENKILLSGTEDQVREETRRIIDILGSDGRYIVAPSHDYLLPEVPARNIVAMYEEAKKYGIGK